MNLRLIMAAALIALTATTAPAADPRHPPPDTERVGQAWHNGSLMNAIRPVMSTRFGRLFVVGDTARTFSILPQAETYARKNPR
jgi:hypothetical protein